MRAASPRGIYEAADGGWLAIAASNQTIAMRLFDAMGRPDMKTAVGAWTSQYMALHLRPDNPLTEAELQQIVIAWIKQRPRDEVLAILEKFDVVAAAVNDASDIAADPHFLERTLRPLTGTVFGDVLTPGPVHVQGYDGPGYDGVPAVGEHTAAVLGDELGLSTAELADLSGRGVISSSPATV